MSGAPPVIDLRLVRYGTTAITGDGSEIVLDPYVTKATREETDDSFSQSLHLTLVDAPLPDGTSLSEVITLGVRLVHGVSFDGGESWDEAMQWDLEVMAWQPKDTDQTFQVIAYDPMQLLQGEMAKIHAFYPAGKAGKDVIVDLFAQFDIPAGTIAGPTTTMPKILFSGKAGDLLLKVLQHALAMGDKCYLPSWNGASVDVIVPGVNDPLRYYDGTKNVTAASEMRDTLDRVEEATVLGAAADDQDPNRTTLPAVAKVTVATSDETVTGIRPLVTYTDPEHAPPMKFAPKPKRRRRLKTTLRNPNADTPKLAKDSATVVVARQSVPVITRDFTCFNADDVRKGDLAFFRAGRCDEYQSILSVVHDLDARTMKVRTAAKGTALYKAQRMDVSRSALAGGLGGLLGGAGAASDAAGIANLFAWCRAHLGIPYEYGAKGPRTYDCSGWTQAAFREVFGVEIGGSTSAQLENNPEGDGKPGDLVLFGVATFQLIGGSQHVGIVAEDGVQCYNQIEPTGRLSNIQAIAEFQNRGIIGYRRPVDFYGGGAGAGTGSPVAAGGYLSAAPPMLRDALVRWFPEAERENAAGVTYMETGGWSNFVNEVYPDKSYGWFQINSLAHGGDRDYWMDTDNNVGFARQLFDAGGWTRDWKCSSYKLHFTDHQPGSWCTR